EQEVNVIQQTLGTATQDIGEIQNLPNSANGDFAFSAESGTVWMYDNSWDNIGDIVPDQVAPASDVTPLVDSGTGVAGTSNEYSRGDHQHLLQISTVLPAKDTATGEVGVAATYARSNHTHHVNLSNSVPKRYTATGTAGSSNIYANGIYLGCDPNSTTGTISVEWSIVNTHDGEFRIGVGDQLLQSDQGLKISADGNTLSFNGSVIAGTGAYSGASNRSVNYSA
ncbi:MAG: hypothetical protein EZS28_044147, partial [Streblomastix strix]